MTNPDGSPHPHREEGVARFRRFLEDELGFVRGHDDDSPEPAMSSYTVLAGPLPDDPTHPTRRCGMCLRDLHPQRRTYLHSVIPDAPKRGIADEPVCPCCASLAPHQHPVVINRWFALPLANRRRHLTLHHGFDPTTRELRELELTFGALTELEASGEMVATTERMTVSRLHYIGVPATFWDVLALHGGQM